MNIIWTTSALQQQNTIADYIYEEFGTNSLIDFYTYLDKTEDNLVAFPELGKVEPLLQNGTKLYRSFVVTKLCKIIYYIDGENIYIVDLWDTRREPDLQAKRIK